MTLLTQALWMLLAALTVENLLLPQGLGFSRMLRSARKPEHRAWYALFVGIFSAISLELSLLLTPQLFPSFGNVLRPLSLALCAAAAYALAAALLSRLAPRFYRRHGAVLAPAAINTVVLAMPGHSGAGPGEMRPRAAPAGGGARALCDLPRFPGESGLHQRGDPQLL